MRVSCINSNKWLSDTKPAFRRGWSMWCGVRLHELILHRYFAGVQGDTKRQGELFGIKNIFRLHEDALATKMAVSMRECQYTYV